jgi:hypothetical protein
LRVLTVSENFEEDAIIKATKQLVGDNVNLYLQYASESKIVTALTDEDYSNLFGIPKTNLDNQWDINKAYIVR